MKPLKRTIVSRLAPAAAYRYIRLVHATSRIRRENPAALEAARRATGTFVMAFWHARFVMMPYASPSRKMVGLLSRHRDARMLGEVLRRFGYHLAWGSTTAGGATATRELLRRARDGWDLAIAPDGPRGPRRVAQPGVVGIARLTGRVILPVTFSARPMRRLGSWDRTLLPMPFCRGLFVFGDPIPVPRDADEAEQARLVARVTEVLNELTDRADRAMGVPTLDPAATDTGSGG